MEHESRNDGFIAVILFSAAAAGMLYLIQQYWIDPLLDSRPLSALFRTLRMLIVYVIPAIWWLKRNNKESTFNSLGLSFQKGQRVFIIGTGLALYSIALAAFMLWPPQSCGFTFWQANRCTDTVLSDWFFTLPLICIMAMITDLWTRGFVLLQAADKWGERPAIILQNSLWLILHLYELELLAPSMSWFGAIALALFLGLIGDLIALRTRSVVGLMAGHALLNVGWAISLATWFSP